MRLLKLAFAASLAVAPFATAEAQYFSNASTPTADGSPFWDVVSDDDGRGCNIGYVLSGTYAGCENVKLTGYSAPWDAGSFTTAWFAHQFANVNGTVGFGFFTGAGAELTYFGGIAGANPLQKLAIRDLSNGTILHEFTSAANTYTFVGAGMFDIGIASYDPISGVPNFFSWTAAQPSQFAVFGSGETYGTSASCGETGCWIGAEDVGNTGGDYDYNDGILRITGASVFVPEPASALLVMSGLAGLVGVARRRKQV